MQAGRKYTEQQAAATVARLKGLAVSFGTVLFIGPAGGEFLRAACADTAFVVSSEIDGAQDCGAIQLDEQYHEEEYFDLIFCDHGHDPADFDALVNSVKEDGHIIVEGAPDEYPRLIGRENIDFVDHIDARFFLLRKAHSTSLFA